MSKIYTAYFDRSFKNIEGKFTIHEYDPETKVTKAPFRQMAARSGQKGYEASSWTRGKSPIPFGEYFLWLQPKDRGTEPGARGIGEFYPISNKQDNPRLISNRDREEQERWDIGLHKENALPGSAGCIVLVTDRPSQKKEVAALFDFLVQLGKTNEFIKLKVL